MTPRPEIEVGHNSGAMRRSAAALRPYGSQAKPAAAIAITLTQADREAAYNGRTGLLLTIGGRHD